jgi:hypothetical protein
VKVLAVPADAAGEGATGGTTGVVGTKITLDGPVVGDIEGAPMGIVILNGSHLTESPSMNFQSLSKQTRSLACDAREPSITTIKKTSFFIF